MLKSSRETLNLADAMDHLERNFILSPESVVKDLSSLKRDLIEPAQQNPIRDSVANAKRTNNNHNNSLSNYLFGNPQVQQGGFRHGSGNETDSFDIDQHMPNPQPLPQPQPRVNHQLEESQKTAYFIPNEQTFLEDNQTSKGKGFIPVLPESVKKPIHPHTAQYPQDFESPGYKSHSGKSIFMA